MMPLNFSYNVCLVYENGVNGVAALAALVLHADFVMFITKLPIGQVKPIGISITFVNKYFNWTASDCLIESQI